jgi:two-component system LytT family response regulator
MTFSCVIIEDEPYAQKLLESYILKTPFLSLIKTFNNPLEAIPFLKDHVVDVIFLDIEMPLINGMEFLNSMNKPMAVIFTTAYSQYAVESYERGAIDYLLKPINYDRFLKAVNRIPQNKEDKSSTSENSFMYVKTNRTFVKIDYTDLFFIEGLKDYVIFRTSQSKHIVHTNLKKLETTLPGKFQRVHNSFIINLDKMVEFKDNHVSCLDTKIPVSKKYHDVLIQRINSKLL